MRCPFCGREGAKPATRTSAPECRCHEWIPRDKWLRLMEAAEVVQRMRPSYGAWCARTGYGEHVVFGARRTA